MTDRNEFNAGDFLAGAMLGLVVTLILAMLFGVNKWHDRTCIEQFNQAVTASDSLTVIVDDSYCNTRLDR